MKKIVFSVILMMSLTCASAQLKNADGNATIAKIKTANEKVSTISCKFNRTIKQAMINKATESKGDFNYTRANKLSMKYTTSDELVVINDNDVAIGKNGKTRTLRSTGKHAEPLVNTLLGCVSGNLNKLDGKLESVKESNGATTVLVDVDNFRVGQSRVTKVEIKYDSNLLIQSIKMIESDGSYTLYELQSVTTNKAIAESVYAISKTKK